jgi:hypothetical protein
MESSRIVFKIIKSRLAKDPENENQFEISDKVKSIL